MKIHRPGNLLFLEHIDSVLAELEAQTIKQARIRRNMKQARKQADNEI